VEAEHAGPRSLRRLFDAVLVIGSDLDLPSTLRRIVEAAVELVDARYGALGVLDEAGTGLAEFITVGVDEAMARSIGVLPKGLGILGSLITDARPLRLAQLGEDWRSVGFPPGHPSMTSFLGVPILVRGQVFGNLYLTDKTTAEVFTDVDEELAMSLASAAGVAIENARLYEQARERERMLAAIQEIAAVLLEGVDRRAGLQLVARHARELLDADLATVALPDAAVGDMVLEVADGPDADGLVGRRFARGGSVSGDVLRTGQPVVLLDAAGDPRRHQPLVRKGTMGPALFVPLVKDGRPFGTLAVARAAAARTFSDADLATVQRFAAQAGMVLAGDEAREARHRHALLEDQERIGRDLHDTVIQRLFAVGLSLQGAVRLIDSQDGRSRVEDAVDELDLIVRHIRTVIFGVQASGQAAGGVRGRVLDVTREAARVLGFEPGVAFAGAIDTTVEDGVADDLLATLREALSNVARHAAAGRVDVGVSVDRDLILTVADDGVGPPTDHTGGGRGLRNMAVRAARRGGTCTFEGGEPGGSILCWRVPRGSG
jgi:GAF domain-containing protein